MTRNRPVLCAASLLFVLLFAAVGAHAAEEGGNAAAERTTEFFKWINFAIVAGVIFWLCLKKAPAFFGGRAEAIGSAISKATNAKAVADAQLREAEMRLANLQKEVVELRASALGYDPDLAACGAAVFRRVIRRKYLQLLRSIDAGHPDDRAVCPGAHRGGTIKCNQGVLGASSVDLERLAAPDREVEVARRGAAASPRQKLRHIEGVAAVQLLVLNLLPGYLALHRARLRL